MPRWKIKHTHTHTRIPCTNTTEPKCTNCESTYNKSKRTCQYSLVLEQRKQRLQYTANSELNKYTRSDITEHNRF